MLVCGVDDAGRGSLLGPLVIAGVLIEKSKIKKLKEMGIKDSKKLSPRVRENLYQKILEYVDSYYVARISPKIIDRSVKNHKLNHLEAKYMAKVISKLKPTISYVDCCDVNTVRFGKEVSKFLNNEKVKSYHHADNRFVIVSAASIIAKVNRDKEISKLHKNFDCGSGYPSDTKTTQFVEQHFKKYKEIPHFVRMSWQPVQNLLNQS